MEIKHPCTSITGSELSIVNHSYAYDGIVALSDFVVSIITPADEAAAIGACEVGISSGECWIAGRYWKTEESMTITVPYSESAQTVRIKCDTTQPTPLVFSVYAAETVLEYAAGIYEIPIAIIVSGALTECNIPLSNGGEYPGVKVYEGNNDGYIRIRKISADMAHLSIQLYNEYPSSSGDGTPVFEIPDRYMPELLTFNNISRPISGGASFSFVGFSLNRDDGSFRDWVRYTIDNTGELTAKTATIAGMMLSGDVVYPIKRGY